MNIIKQDYSNIRFRGAVLTEIGKNLEIVQDIRLPELKHGQVLVKLKYAGLCQSQLQEATGGRGEDKYLPHFLGHEGVGEVIATGSGVTKVERGEKVVLGWIKGDGLEGGGTIFFSSKYPRINAGPVTTFSEYTIASENRIYKKPSQTPDHLSVLYGCALPTGAGIVFNEMMLEPNASVGVVGLGGIGLSSLMALREFSPKHLVAIDIEDHKLKLADELGATCTLSSTDKNVVQKVQSLVGNGGLDFVIEAGGKVETIELGFNLIRPNGGQLVFASHPPEEDRISLRPFDLICGKSIRGSWGGNSKPDIDIQMLGKLYENSKLNLDVLISHEYGLEEINQAMEALSNRKIARALISLQG